MTFLRLVIAATILWVSGCAVLHKNGAEETPTSKAEILLSNGIKSYEDGEYKTAVNQLQGALDAGLEKTGDKVRAHKYLAFTYCVSSREKQCREEFKKVLEINPSFDLTPAESGHPLWGSVFRNVKSKSR